MKRFKGIDYDFRPASYWEDTDGLAALLRNVKGTNRRQMIRDYWEAGKIDELSEELLTDSLDDDQRARLEGIDPSFMGGEYLPEYRSNEVEIARIELKSTTADVISVRARPSSRRVLYSIYDEYNTQFEVSPASTKRPLSLGELIELIDNTGGGISLGMKFTLMSFPVESHSVDEAGRFTTVVSLFYPQITLHYKNLTEWWYNQHQSL